MRTLETTYAGLKLKNPIIVSSSSLTDSVEKNKKLCEAGAGAIVLKSLFEEQILLEVEDMEDFDPFVVGGNDLTEYVRHHKLEEYFALIRDTKKVVDVPVIASINAYDEGNWTAFAKKIEEAGADALEINILALQTSLEYQYGSFEKKHIDILKLVKKAVKIPVIMKLGDNFTNPVALIHQLRANGADGVVLFNRFYNPTIDIDRMKVVPGSALSVEEENSNTLRWISLLAAQGIPCCLSASTGVHTAEDVVRQILAGASSVQVCSTLYRNGVDHIAVMVKGFEDWMKKHNFGSIAELAFFCDTAKLKGRSIACPFAQKELIDKAFDTLNMRGSRPRMEGGGAARGGRQSAGSDRGLSERDRLVRTYEQRMSELKTFENNMGFLTANTKSGNSLVQEMERRIASLKEEIAELEQRIKELDNA